MISVPTAPWAHYVGDFAAWAAAAGVTWWQHRRWPQETGSLAGITPPSYYLTLALSALAGAWLTGSLNSMPSGLAPSHSIAGALAGGIVGVETWKWWHGIRRSTGSGFVLPLATGIMVGRLGCFFSGLPDLTFGVTTSASWAVNLGDGLGRHPVQIYESAAMALFLSIYGAARVQSKPWAIRHGFHAFIIYYAVQRFFWEFLKPYHRVVGPLNLFHFLCLGMIIYGIVWWRRSERGECSSDTGAQDSALCVPQPDDQPV